MFQAQFHITRMSWRTQRILKMVNGIMPPLPRRAMVPDRNCRQLDCPVPIAHRGRGSAEVDLKATFSYKTYMAATTSHNKKTKL